MKKRRKECKSIKVLLAAKKESNHSLYDDERVLQHLLLIQSCMMLIFLFDPKKLQH